MKKNLHAYSLRRRFGLLLHRWHRRIGVCACLFIVWMALSGWLLNHTAALNLAQRTVTAEVMVAHYGLRTEIPRRALVARAHWLVADGIAVLDGKKIEQTMAQPVGMAIHGNILFVATASRLILLDENAALIDNVEMPLARVERIGNGCNGVVIANADTQIATQDGVQWSPCIETIEWAQEVALTPARYAAIAPLFQTGVSLERVLLDLHSGRFFGTWGPYVVDTIGAGMILLAASGLLLFVRHRPKRHH